MRPRIGVAILHGIGTQRRGFADSFVATLAAALGKREVPAGSFAFEQVHWADVLAPAERLLLAESQRDGFLDWQPIRMFVIETLADAVAYRRGYPVEWDAYHQIHWEVYRSLALLEERLSDPLAPLVVIAHSLGSVIISDHVWDEQKRQGFGRTSFTRCETLSGIITFGSNIPLFTLGLPEVRCIKFPAATSPMPEATLAAARWRNYYDRDDVLGYPLRTLSESFRATVDADIEMTAGGPFTSWNPLSHNGYWSEHLFIDGVSEQLADLHLAHCGEGVELRTPAGVVQPSL